MNTHTIIQQIVLLLSVLVQQVSCQQEDIPSLNSCDPSQLGQKIPGFRGNLYHYEYNSGRYLEPDYASIGYKKYARYSPACPVYNVSIGYSSPPDSNYVGQIYCVNNVYLQHFVVEYEGFFVAPQTGIYTLTYLGNDDTRIYMGSKNCDELSTSNYEFDTFVNSRSGDLRVSRVMMTAGETYPMRILFTNDHGDIQHKFDLMQPDSTLINSYKDLAYHLISFPPSVSSSSFSSSSSSSAAPSESSSSAVPSESSSSVILSESSSSAAPVESSSSSNSSESSFSSTSSESSFSSISSESPSSVSSESSSPSSSEHQIELPTVSDPSVSGTVTKTGPYTIGTLVATGVYIEVNPVDNSVKEMPRITNPSCSGTATRTGPYTVGTEICTGVYLEVNPDPDVSGNYGNGSYSVITSDSNLDDNTGNSNNGESCLECAYPTVKTTVQDVKPSVYTTCGSYTSNGNVETRTYVVEVLCGCEDDSSLLTDSATNSLLNPAQSEGVQVPTSRGAGAGQSSQTTSAANFAISPQNTTVLSGSTPEFVNSAHSLRMSFPLLYVVGTLFTLL